MASLACRKLIGPHKLNEAEKVFSCKICSQKISDRTDLIGHLRVEHDTLEVASYAASTMFQEQERDMIAAQFHERFDRLKKELTSS
jgi:hypothetical protein